MHANRVHVQTLCKGHDPHEDLIGIMNDGARVGTRHQRSVRPIRSIRERLARGSQARRGARRGELRPGQAEEYERGIDGGDREGDGVRHSPIANRDVVQRAMCLDMLQAGAGLRGNRRERVNLTNYEICNLFCRQLQIAAAKMFTIVKARMRPDGNAMVEGQQNRLAHDCRTTGMTTTCDVS